MNKIFALLITVFACFISYSQNKSSEEVYSKVLKSQINYELETNNFTSMYINFIDTRFSNIKLSHDNIKLNNLTKKELKLKSRSGIDLIEVYPLKIINNQIIIETLSVYSKRKKITIYGKSTYYFKYDCEKEEYYLSDKQQKMI